MIRPNTTNICLAIKRRIKYWLGYPQESELASVFCRGSGIEIGPMSKPFPFRMGTKVVYADIAGPQKLRDYRKSNPIPGLYAGNIPEISIILEKPKFEFPTVYHGNFDFVFSSNVLEHHPNPLFFLIDQLKVLKPAGVLYCKIPNKHYMYDRLRTSTPGHIFWEKYNNNIFDMTVEEAKEIILMTDSHLYYDQLKQDIDANSRLISKSNDGTHHYSVFDTQNTYELILSVLQVVPETCLAHLSSRRSANIEFALIAGNT